jgi:ATP-dependent DNA helicase PIF1
MTSSIEINEQFKRALDILENSDKSIFITGKAGTGKSTLLSYYRNIARKKVVVLAPTGVAALNIKGQTIHSFFGFKPNITQQSIRQIKADRETIYQKLETLVIDEVSMVRADLLDCIDRFLRLNGPFPGRPFGGVQMAFVGDLYQLPPVVTSQERVVFQSMYKTPYFFSARAFSTFEMEFVELEKIYRQHDSRFIELLNAIRNRTVDSAGLAYINGRYDPEYEPEPGSMFIYLTTTNSMALEINERQIKRLKGRARSFAGEIEGEFGKEYLPTGTMIKLKKGAQVMMLNNDSFGRWVNGSVGRITGFGKDEEGEAIIKVELAEGDEVYVSPYTWEIFRFFVEESQIKSEVVGAFTQYPLMLAWAVTIHKAQGKTFNRAIIDIGRGTFAHGQMYVALSRCTSMDGLVLKKPVEMKHIWMDRSVVDFMTGFQYRRAEKECSAENKIRIIEGAIREKSDLEITYLKPDDTKSRRIVHPLKVGEFAYAGKKFTGLRAYCKMRKEERSFRIDRILELKIV